MRYRGGLRLRCDDEADGEEVGPCIRLSRQSLEGVFYEVRRHGVLGSSQEKYSSLALLGRRPSRLGCKLGVAHQGRGSYITTFLPLRRKVVKMRRSVLL